MAMRVAGTVIAAERAQRVRADIDYFDQREERGFVAFKLIVWGVPAVGVIWALWGMYA